MTDLHSESDYRKSINGLRAVAVLSVLLFHCNKDWLPGGFVGVDIFFVISGYLITRIIDRELSTNQFSFLRFYQRRIARIFPLFVSVLVSTLAATWILYQPQDFSSAGALATASILGLTNLKLIFQGSYFAASVDSQPFLHYWSLAIEEQFYVFFPLFLFLLRGKLQSQEINVIGMQSDKNLLWRKRILLVEVAWVVSLGICIWLTLTKPVLGFYLLPSRGWELMTGSVLAIRQIELSGRVAVIAGWIGSSLITFSLLLLNERLLFPGYWAIFPVIGTALCIACQEHSVPFISKLLSASLMQTIGNLSYALYLWHWPVYSLIDYSLYLESDSLRLIMKAALTVALSVFSYYLLEQPCRRILNQGAWRGLCFASFALVVTGVAFAGFVVRNKYYLDADESKLARGGLHFPQGRDAPKVVLLGDSQGSMFGFTLREICRDLQYDFHLMSVAAKDPIPPSRLHDQSMQFLRTYKPEIIVVAAAWAQKIGDDQNRMENYMHSLAETCESLIVITQPPILPKYANREYIRQNGDCLFDEDVSTSARRVASQNLIQSLAFNDPQRIQVIDATSPFFDSSSRVRFHDERGIPYFHDRNHLNGNGANLLREDLIRAIQRGVDRRSMTAILPPNE